MTTHSACGGAAARARAPRCEARKAAARRPGRPRRATRAQRRRRRSRAAAPRWPTARSNRRRPTPRRAPRARPHGAAGAARRTGPAARARHRPRAARRRAARRRSRPRRKPGRPARPRERRGAQSRPAPRTGSAGRLAPAATGADLSDRAMQPDAPDAADAAGAVHAAHAPDAAQARHIADPGEDPRAGHDRGARGHARAVDDSGAARDPGAADDPRAARDPGAPDDSGAARHPGAPHDPGAARHSGAPEDSRAGRTGRRAHSGRLASRPCRGPGATPSSRSRWARWRSSSPSLQRPGLEVADTKVDLHVAPAVPARRRVARGRRRPTRARLGRPVRRLPVADGAVLRARRRARPADVGRRSGCGSGPLLALAAWGVVRLLDALARAPARRRAPARGGAARSCSTRTSSPTRARTSSRCSAYAALPWLLLCVHRGLRDPRGGGGRPRSRSSLTSTGGGVNAAVDGVAAARPAAAGALRAGLGRGGVGRGAWRSLVRLAPAGGARLAVVGGAAARARALRRWTSCRTPSSRGRSGARRRCRESLRLMGFWTSYIGVGYGGTLRAVPRPTPAMLCCGSRRSSWRAARARRWRSAVFAWTRRCALRAVLPRADARRPARDVSPASPRARRCAAG